MHNHVNGVLTLDSKINKHIPNVAKHLQIGGYQTAMVGKWHLGEGKPHEPSGFDYWSVLPGQGVYWDPVFHEQDGSEMVVPGYATNIVTDKSIDFIKRREKDRPFFLMCHHKAPHRSWECDEKHKDWYKYPVKLPDTFNDDYKNRANAAKVAKMRVAEDMTYLDLGLAQPEGPSAKIGYESGDAYMPNKASDRTIPVPADVTEMRLIDKETGENFTFNTHAELAEFKFQRYMQRYLRTIQSIDDNVGRLLQTLDDEGIAENTVVIYTSDQGYGSSLPHAPAPTDGYSFFLGQHGWFDKRFLYEESFQMPFRKWVHAATGELAADVVQVIRWPSQIKPGSINNDIISNVDFAPTWLEMAALRQPSYMQGYSFLPLLQGRTPPDWQKVAYHRYWMNADRTHNALAHYGIRDQRYKLIFWYADDLCIEGAMPTQPGQGVDEHGEKEWELFDCHEDPSELFNVYHKTEYAGVRAEMTRLLELKMAEIGDVPYHLVEPTKAKRRDHKL